MDSGDYRQHTRSGDERPGNQYPDSSRDSAPTNRCTAARSSWSSRPKEYKIFVRETPAAGSHSLCASCRYRTGPRAVCRVDDFTYTH